MQMKHYNVVIINIIFFYCVAYFVFTIKCVSFFDIKQDFKIFINESMRYRSELTYTKHTIL